MKIVITTSPMSMFTEDFAKVVGRVTKNKVAKDTTRKWGFVVGGFKVWGGNITAPQETTEATIDSIIKALKKRDCECKIE